MGFWEPLFFWLFAFGALATSCAVIFMRNPLYCALALIADFFCFAGLYVLLSAHFLAVVQILVYGGAIMVLFLFIIMLLNLRGDNLVPNRFQVHYVIAIISGVVIFLFSAGVIMSAVDFDEVEQERQAHAERLAEVDDPDDVAPLSTETAIPGLHADAEEQAVEQAYRQKMRMWKEGVASPSDDTYPRFDPQRQYEVPPSLDPEPFERQARAGDADTDTAARVVPGRKGLYVTFKHVSIKLVNRFVIPFELTAILLLAAIVGAVILAKRRVT